jgi:hypothetical protein
VSCRYGLRRPSLYHVSHISSQESLAATYGAGISSACVVDIGSVFTGVACVDDGLVIGDTRYVKQSVSASGRLLIISSACSFTWVVTTSQNSSTYFYDESGFLTGGVTLPVRTTGSFLTS